MANSKVWTEQEREAAAKLVDFRRAFRPGYHLAHDNRESMQGQMCSDFIDLQCELTAKEAELSEAVELLKRASRRLERSLVLGNNVFAKEIYKYLKRHTEAS